MNTEKVLALAKLSRIDLAETEAANLSQEFAAILNYVGEVKGASLPEEKISEKDFSVRNVLREDGEPHKTHLYTEEILAEAPHREGDYVKVKKII